MDIVEVMGCMVGQLFCVLVVFEVWGWILCDVDFGFYFFLMVVFDFVYCQFVLWGLFDVSFMLMWVFSECFCQLCNLSVFDVGVVCVVVQVESLVDFGYCVCVGVVFVVEVIVIGVVLSGVYFGESLLCDDLCQVGIIDVVVVILVGDVWFD